MSLNISNRLKRNTYVKKNYNDAVLALYTSLEAAESAISTSNLCTAESIDEAKFNVTVVEDALIDLILNHSYNVNEYELKDSQYYNKIYKYLIIKSIMRKSLYNFNIYDTNLAYKKNLTKLHTLYFDLINKYLIDDFVVKDNEKIYVKDYDNKYCLKTYGIDGKKIYFPDKSAWDDSIKHSGYIAAERMYFDV